VRHKRRAVTFLARCGVGVVMSFLTASLTSPNGHRRNIISTMSTQTAGTDHVIDETIREALARLEAERKRVTSRLDARISQLRSMLDSDGTLDMFPEPAAQSETIPASEPPSTGDGDPYVAPIGQSQKKVFLYLQTHPHAGYQELADGIFGARDQLTFNKLRSTIWALKKGRWITGGDAGAWKLGIGKRGHPAGN